MDFLSKAKSSNIRDFLATNNTVVLKFSTAVLHFSTTQIVVDLNLARFSSTLLLLLLGMPVRRTKFSTGTAYEKWKVLLLVQCHAHTRRILVEQLYSCTHGCTSSSSSTFGF